MSMENKVVVTGLNLITSLGLNVHENWANLVKGNSGIKKITLFNPEQNLTTFAGQVPDRFDNYVHDKLKKRMAKQMTRVCQICYICASDLIEEEKIDFNRLDRTRCGVILGALSTGDTSVEKGTHAKNRIIKNMNNALSAWIALHYKLEGPNFTVASACSSSAYAIALAYDMIKSGQLDLVIVGGADSIINPEEIEGFNELFTISTENAHPEKASCPFSKQRDGFVIGEGAGMLILESEKSAHNRGAAIYAELAGYALTSEAYHMMSPMKDGEGMAKTMELAIKKTKIKKHEVDYINAHGTSTTLNDKYETLAIKKVFSEYAYQIPVSASKSMLGHTIAAAGAVEAIITIMSIKHSLLTPTINYQADPELDLDYVPDQARQKKIAVALSNSFAFGGHNATIVLKKYVSV